MHRSHRGHLGGHGVARYIGVWLFLGGVVAALFGVPVEELFKPFIIGCLLALVLAVMVGARDLAGRLLGSLIGLVALTAVSVSLHGVGADPRIHTLLVSAIVLVVTVAFIVVVTRLLALREPAAPPPRPTIRQRAMLVDPTPLPYDGDWSSETLSSDDLHLFKDRTHDK